MKAFLDTSSLLKLYHQEEGSGFVMEVLSNDVVEIFLSDDKLLRTLFKDERLNVL